jgi:peptidyl-prolyl cis-trans isomerase SurA
MKKLIITFILVIFAVSVGNAVIIERIVAVVNGKPITLTELQERAIFLKNATGKELPLKEVLRRVILEELQMQEAEKLGLVASDDVVNSYIENFKKENGLSDEDFKKFLQEKGITLEAYKEEIKRRITINRLMNYQIRMHVAVADEEVKEYYEKHKNDEFKLPPMAEVWLIFIPKEEGKELAEKVYTMAVGGYSFEALAKQYSKGPNAEKGGYLGMVKKGELMEAIDQFVFGSDKTIALIEGSNGWYIVKVGKRVKEAYVPFDKVKDKIREKLLQERTEKRYQKWLNSLLDKSVIKIYL